MRGEEPSQEEIRVLYTNAQSLASKALELEALSLDLKPDLILLCETWCNSTTNTASLEISGYNLQQDLRKDRTDTANGIGGGLIVYTKHGLDILPCDLNSDFNQYCKFSLANKSEKVFIYLLYRPLSAGQKSKDDLCDLIQGAEKNSIFIGDFNLPGIDWSSGAATGGDTSLVNTLQENLFSQLVDFPTHIKGNCLDLIVTNVPEKIDNICEVGRLGRSDHSMIQFSLRIAPKLVSSRRKMVNWKRANWDRIRKGLEDTIWPTTGDTRTAEETWQLLRRRVEELTKESVPECDFKARKSDWMTGEILREIRRKRRLWKGVKSGGNREDYEAAARKVAKMIRSAKRGVEKRLAMEKKREQQAFLQLCEEEDRQQGGGGTHQEQHRRDDQRRGGDGHGAQQLLCEHLHQGGDH